ncbi:MAG: 3-hydroxybutyryl-CoA dehydrogenase [Candidatus Kapabacteria bacterium]|nr:3-hydroxybutyryl-CoA dehydrogenase [Candidatus Kapabacteria bacterium]
MAAAQNIAATVIVSVLTTTATELGMMAGCPTRTIGTSLAPSILSSVPFVEMSAGLNTTDRHVIRARQLFEHLGYSIEQVEDRVGLVQMRVLATIINEAAFAVMEGVASPEDIDQAMKLGTNYPKGPLAWADEIGLPYILLILDALHREYQQERYRPCVLIKQYVRAGWLGVGSGRGFYRYDS